MSFLGEMDGRTTTKKKSDNKDLCVNIITLGLSIDQTKLSSKLK